MALCKERDKLRASSSDAFDKVIRPGTDVAYEGIYRCIGCLAEMVVIAGKPFPGSSHRTHSADCIQDRWQLLVGLSKS